MTPGADRTGLREASKEKLVTLPVGAKGFDTIERLTPAQAAALKASGFEFAVPYLDMCDAAYVQMLLSAGLALMFTSYSRKPGWEVTADEGIVTGNFMARLALECGALPGSLLWLDLEGMAPGTSAETADAYVRAAWSTITSAGYICGAYVGDSLPFSAQALYELPVTAYWHSMSSVPTPANVGFQMFQLYDSQTIAGVSLDIDVVCRDYRERLPMAMAG